MTNLLKSKKITIKNNGINSKLMANPYLQERNLSNGLTKSYGGVRLLNAH